MHHIPGIKNELSDYISRNNFDALIGESSEALAKEAFQRMDVQLDLSMRTAGILEGWSLTDYQSEYEEILQTLSTGLEPRVIDGHQWYKNNQYVFYEDRIVVPEARLDGCLQWSHLSSGHTGANRSVDFFRECFYSSLTLTELRSRMQTIVDACGCHASKQSDSRDRGLISSFLAHANCTPFFSPKQLDFVTEKNSFFCHLENTVFQALQKNAFFISFAHFLLFLGG